MNDDNQPLANVLLRARRVESNPSHHSISSNPSNTSKLAGGACQGRGRDRGCGGNKGHGHAIKRAVRQFVSDKREDGPDIAEGIND